MTISQYFSKLCVLLHELEYYQDFQVDCLGDVIKLQKLIEKEWIMTFGWFEYVGPDDNTGITIVH